MTTVSDIVTRALRKIGVVSKGDNASAEDMSEGVAAFNAMVHAWKLRGVDLAHSDMTSSSVFTYGDEYIEGTIYLLASRLSPDYEVPPSFNADAWFEDFRRATMTVGTAAMPRALRVLPSRIRRDNLA